MKMPYEIWPLDRTQRFINERVSLFLMDDPPCSPYGMSPYWKCACTKLEAQLNKEILL